MINLREIDKNNWLECIRLTRTLSDEENEYVAPNVYSIAEAQFYEKAHSKAIYNEKDIMIGYTMYGESEDDKDLYFIDRLMISGEFRKKGYAEETIREIIQIAKMSGYNILGSSTDLENIKMQNLFDKIGFYTKGEIDEGEKIYYYNII